MRKKLCGEFHRHDMQKTEGGWQSCSRCGTLSSKGVPFDVRFWSHVKKSDGCWIYDGCLSNDGYAWVGRKDWGGTPRRAHRVAWELTYGPIPKGEGFHGTAVLHRCDNRACVRPDHLFLGTQKGNMEDMVQKGRKGGAKLTPAQVAEIKHLHKHGHQRGELAQRFGVTPHTIYMVASGKTWKSLEVRLS